jgi:SnoaL-like domain
MKRGALCGGICGLAAALARGIWTFEGQLWNWPPGESDGQFHGYGIYHETYVKLAEGWRITSMEIQRIRPTSCWSAPVRPSA